jgi:hypothetical protein
MKLGWTTLLIDEQGGIIAGHGRVLAAQNLGLADIPVMVAAGWSEAQKRAYVLADNKLALNAGWEQEIGYSDVGYPFPRQNRTHQPFEIPSDDRSGWLFRYFSIP